jgi:hypothetical protein
MPAITTEPGRVETFRAAYGLAKKRLEWATRAARREGVEDLDTYAVGKAMGSIEVIEDLARDLGIDLEGDYS